MVRRNRRQIGERGAVLGVALVLLVAVLAAGGLAFYSLRGELGTAGQDRLARQLLACAEQGLAFGRQHFATALWSQRNLYLAAGSCARFPCPPFPKGAPGPLLQGYPDGAPFSGAVTVGGLSLTYQVGIYNNPENPPSPFVDNDGVVVVYSRCRDAATQQARTVQALISVNIPVSTDYSGQAGRGFRNHGNTN